MLISSWKEKGGFSIYVDRFRKFLKLEDKYPEFKDLYKRVIRPVYAFRGEIEVVEGALSVYTVMADPLTQDIGLFKACVSRIWISHFCTIEVEFINGVHIKNITERNDKNAHSSECNDNPCESADS